MNFGHASQCADWREKGQAPIGTLREKPIGSFSWRMAHDFKRALEWHMQTHGTRIVDLVNGAGVSRSVVNKVLDPDRGSTAVENAVLIAAFYGKTVNQFLACEDVTPAGMAQNVFDMLTPEDARMLHAQMLGILRARSAKPN